ncbi:MAG: hypothetical protein R3B99_02915 [Polyangiales bacterium]
MIRRFSPIFPLFLLAAALGCASEEGLLVQPPFEDGKADVNDRVIDRGPLGYDAPVAGEFTEDLEFHGYHLQARAGAVVTLDVTRTGSSRNLDSSLFVYGPRRAEDGFGSEAIAFDDDAGWGRLSRIRSFTFDLEGEYLVVIGTANARGRGRYRLEARCESGDCLPAEPPPAGLCPAAFVEAIEACVADGAEGDELDPRDLLEQCANVEVIAPAFDALCAGEDAPAESRALARRGSRGKSFPRVSRSFGAITSTRAASSARRTARSFVRARSSPRDVFAWATLTPVETAQVIAAVDVSSWDPTTLAEAFEAVDGGEINRTELWDASNRRGFVAYEYGAGDNSYGAIFEHGTTIVAARIQDGDLYGCETTWGPERRECDTDAACAEGLRCVGVTEPIGRGRCVDLAATHPAEESSCSAEAPCPAGSGLQCQGAAFGGEGICRPAWLSARSRCRLRNRFRTAARARWRWWPTGSRRWTSRSASTCGSTTRTADLRVTVTNPSGNELPDRRRRRGPWRSPCATSWSGVCRATRASTACGPCGSSTACVGRRARFTGSGSRS